MKTKLKTNADQVASNLREMPRRLHSNLGKRMNAATLILVREIKEKMSGDILKVRSGRLRGSINQKVDQGANKIVGRVGSNVVYAPVHEFGATIRAKNAPYLKFPIGGSALTGAGLRSYAKGAGGQWASVKEVKIPARKPFRRSFDNKFEAMRATLGLAIRDAIIGKE